MPTNTPVAEDLARNLQLVFKKLKAARMHRARIHPEVEPSSYPILYALSMGEPLRVSAIADTVHSDVSTVSRQVNRLEGQGIVTRSTDPEDRRASVITLTEHGYKLLCEERRDYAEWLGDMLSTWDEADVCALNNHLARLYDAVPVLDNHTNNTHKKQGKLA